MTWLQSSFRGRLNPIIYGRNIIITTALHRSHLTAAPLPPTSPPQRLDPLRVRTFFFSHLLCTRISIEHNTRRVCVCRACVRRSARATFSKTAHCVRTARVCFYAYNTYYNNVRSVRSAQEYMVPGRTHDSGV